MNSYLFILCPNYCGSTILWKLVSTSNAVSALATEGQYVPEVRSIMRQDPWNYSIQFPWKYIKEVWDGYWDHDKPFLIEKSPPNIIRTKEILEHFSPAYFLLMVRNPYAHCEGLIRRTKMDAQSAGEHAIRCLRQQAENKDNLKNSLCFTYEELTENPESVSQRIQSFLPQLGELQHSQKFKVRSISGFKKRKIVNFNQKNIHALSINELKQINNVFKENSDILDHWGYKYYEPSLRHRIDYIIRRIRLLVSNMIYKGLLLDRLEKFLIRVVKKLFKL